MIILTIRTDKPDAEIGLYRDFTQVAYLTWQAHRELAETIHTTIDQMLHDNQLSLQNVQAVLVYQGPGSFTGLRIGIAVANALAAGLRIPIVGTQSEDWLVNGLTNITRGINHHLVMPEYGALPNVSTPKK